VVNNLISQVMTVKKPAFAQEADMIETIRNGYLVDRGPKFKQKKSFSPSTLVWGNGSCARYWYYAFSGAEFTDDADAYAVANMTNGTLSHERLQKAMLDGGFLTKDEVEISHDDPPILGYADGLVTWEGEEMVVEIKTMRDEAFKWRSESRKPPTYHLEQILYYMKVLKLSKGLLIYEGKNGHELMIIPVEISDEYTAWGDQAFEWMKTVHQSWVGGRKPDRTYRSNSRVCKGCPVKDLCFSEDKKGDVRIEPLEHLEK
jgi:CRISPR/Cas system-associated exonuclease Cas4 (RecB family)